MNRLFIDLMDTTAVNYVLGGLLIEAAKTRSLLAKRLRGQE